MGTLLWGYKRAFMPSSDWENPSMVSRRRLPMRTDSMRWFSDPSSARSYASQIALTGKGTTDDAVLSIDGEWDFQLFEDADEAKTLVEAGLAKRTGKWGKTNVPRSVDRGEGTRCYER